jgi:hypothetical protein
MFFAARLFSCVFYALLLSAAECDITHVVPIRLLDDANVEPKILQEARQEAAWVLRSLCVEADWMSSTEAKALTLRIVGTPMTPDVPKHSLGHSIVGTTSARNGAVFLLRVRDAQRSFASEVRLPILLGCVLAHEIGHLLLASATHSSEGIMKARFGRAEALKASQRGLIFTRSDRQRLAANHASLTEFERMERHETGLYKAAQP